MGESNSTEGFIHVVAAIIWHPLEEDKILISRRKKGTHLENYWELPGGKLEAGESRLEGLRRELGEELNLILIKASPFKQVEHQYNDRNIFLDVWVVENFSGELHGRERQEIRWISINEIDNYQFPDADLPIFEAIRNNATA
ncbi:MAG: 8-oxo-dGTP diphosphatase MutT [Gammaproteobacteria bacterium]|nr:8-oxo-dGTP diphosphatase MutT [Gammaproteobacteria bacterium]